MAKYAGTTSFILNVMLTIALSSALIQRIASQVTEISQTPGSVSTETNPNRTEPDIKVLNLDICSQTDNLSLTYCSCNNLVASCDFSSYPAPKQIVIASHGQSVKPEFKRLCLCNTPRNVFLDLREDLMPPIINGSSGFHRVDLFNITGPLHFSQAFSLRFSGDLYMSNIRFLKSINGWEFGRGIDSSIENVENLECCSKIKTSQNFNKPLLYIQNTTIGTIFGYGISGIHRWKTIIMDGVQNVHDIRSYGIKLSSENINVSISDCHFNNVYDNGFEIEKFENLVISKTLINNSSPLAFLFRSKLPNSSIVIVNSQFNNVMTWQLDAHQVVCWYNMFDFWYNGTFALINTTTFSDRVFSVEYNTIANYLINDTSSVPPLQTGDSVTFNENVFGKCNCSITSDILIPDLLSKNPSRCDSGKIDQSGINKGNCLIDFKSVMTSCQKNSLQETQFREMCKNPSISLSSFDAKSVKIKASGLNINSPFINEMLKDMKALLHIHTVSSHVESEEEKAFENSTSKSSTESGQNIGGSSGSHGSTVWYVFLTLLGFIVIAGVFVIVVRRRRRPLSSFGPSSAESYDVLTTLT